MKRFRAVIALVIRCAAWLVGVSAGTIAVLFMLDHFGAFPPDSMFFDADFVSPLWISILFVVSGILAFAGRARRYWVPAVIGSAFFIFFGDVSLSALGSVFTQRAIASNRTVRVVTLNVEYYALGVDKVMDAVDQMNADVTLLGEHVLTPGQAEIMNGRLHGRTLIAGHPNSTAIISRLPVVWWKEVELPSHEASLSGGNDPDEIVRQPHRSFLHALVQSDSQLVHVISVRFIAGRPKDHSLRENLRWGRFMFKEQFGEAEFFARYVSALKGPVIFGGDLNACPGSKTVERIRRVATDAYMENNVFGDLTFRVEFPTMRLDYLFCMNGVNSVAASRPRVVVSDHFPVLGSFILPVPESAGGMARTPDLHALPAVDDGAIKPVIAR